MLNRHRGYHLEGNKNEMKDPITTEAVYQFAVAVALAANVDASDVAKALGDRPGFYEFLTKLNVEIKRLGY